MGNFVRLMASRLQIFAYVALFSSVADGAPTKHNVQKFKKHLLNMKSELMADAKLGNLEADGNGVCGLKSFCDDSGLFSSADAWPSEYQKEHPDYPEFSYDTWCKTRSDLDCHAPNDKTGAAKGLCVTLAEYADCNTNNPGEAKCDGKVGRWGIRSLCGGLREKGWAKFMENRKDDLDKLAKDFGGDFKYTGNRCTVADHWCKGPGGSYKDHCVGIAKDAENGEVCGNKHPLNVGLKFCSFLSYYADCQTVGGNCDGEIGDDEKKTMGCK